MIKKILTLFVIWRISLFFVSFLALFFIPQFGGRFPYADQILKITGLPAWIWGFGNFDGVHYLRIAQDAYSAQFTQAFFPLYPILINIFSNFLPKSPNLDTRTFVDPAFFFSGLMLSNLLFFISLFLLYKLFRLDFDKKTSFGSLILLASFPSSFYFGSIYTESLFLCLVVASLLFLRKGKFLLAGIFALFASSTRIFGLLLIPVFLIEIYTQLKSKQIKLTGSFLLQAILGLLIAPLGTIFYMIYLKINFNNPFYFLTAQPIFGAERSGGEIVFLPQVIFRYFKIFATVPLNSLTFFNAFLEFSFTISAFVLLVLAFKKIRLSYFIFTLTCLILPTLTGTFSSMPRYVLMGFLTLPYLFQLSGKYFKLLVSGFVILGVILVSLFVRGYWVA